MTKRIWKDSSYSFKTSFSLNFNMLYFIEWDRKKSLPLSDEKFK